MGNGSIKNTSKTTSAKLHSFPHFKTIFLKNNAEFFHGQLLASSALNQLLSLIMTAQQPHNRNAERIYQLQVARNLKRNYLSHLAHGMLGQTGFNLLTAPTFLPAYILLLSGMPLMVGVVQSLMSFGMMLTPIIGAHLIAHRPQVLKTGLFTGTLMRLMILCIALSGLLLSPESALVSISIFITLFGLFTGIQSVIFNFLMSKIIPVRKRGWLTGFRNFLAGLTSSLIAWVAGEYLFDSTLSATGYSYTFILAFVLTSIGLATLIIVKEPKSPIVSERLSLLIRFKEIPRTLRAEPDFGVYIIARGIASLGRMAMPFYIIYAGSNIELTGKTLGILTICFTMASTTSNLIWGLVADRTGFRFVLLCSLCIWILSTLALLNVSGDLILTCLVFIGIGAGFQGFQNASMNMTLEFGRRQDLPMYIGMANTVTEFAGAIGPLLGGILILVFSYQVTFWVSIAFLGLGGIAIWLLVPEPRTSRR